MNNNPAVAGCGFVADADYEIDGYQTRVYAGINTKETDDENAEMPEISYVAAMGTVWEINEKQLGRNIYLFDEEGNVRLHGIGFGRFEKDSVQRVKKEDADRLIDIANDLASAHLSLEDSLKACLESIISKRED